MTCTQQVRTFSRRNLEVSGEDSWKAVSKAAAPVAARQDTTGARPSAGCGRRVDGLTLTSEGRAGVGRPVKGREATACLLAIISSVDPIAAHRGILLTRASPLSAHNNPSDLSK